MPRSAPQRTKTLPFQTLGYLTYDFKPPFSSMSITCVASPSSYMLLSDAPGLNKIKFMCYMFKLHWGKALNKLQDNLWVLSLHSSCPTKSISIKGKNGSRRPTLCGWWNTQRTLGSGDEPKQYHLIYIKSLTNPGELHKDLTPSDAQITVHGRTSGTWIGEVCCGSPSLRSST